MLFQYLVNTVNNCRKAMTTISKMTVNSKISKTLLEICQYSNFCSVAYRTLHKTLRGKIHLALGMVYSVKQKCKSSPSQETIGLSRITFWNSLFSGTKSLSFPTARQSLSTINTKLEVMFLKCHIVLPSSISTPRCTWVPFLQRW